jgi:hypothetical protein
LEKWQLYWDDSEKNMVLARFLVEITSPNFLGLAAYHAEQAIEMAMKACIFRFGFEEYLRIKRISETETRSIVEFERKETEGRDPTMHHYPLREMIIPALEFVEDEVKKLKPVGSEDEKYPEMRRAIDDMMAPVKVLKDFVNYVNSRPKDDEDPQPKEEIWKYSLGIATFDDKLTERLRKLQDATDLGIIDGFFCLLS